MKQQLIATIIKEKLAKGILHHKCCRGMHG